MSPDERAFSLLKEVQDTIEAVDSLELDGKFKMSEKALITARILEQTNEEHKLLAFGALRSAVERYNALGVCFEEINSILKRALEEHEEIDLQEIVLNSEKQLVVEFILEISNEFIVFCDEFSAYLTAEEAQKKIKLSIGN